MEMLKQVLDRSTEKIWSKKLEGHVFWQQILPTLMDTYFWFRDYHEKFFDFKVHFKERGYYPEFKKDPENEMLKEEMLTFYDRVALRVEEYFADKPDACLNEPAKLYSKLINNEVINMQIRHVTYHVGF